MDISLQCLPSSKSSLSRRRNPPALTGLRLPISAFFPSKFRKRHRYVFFQYPLLLSVACSSCNQHHNLPPLSYDRSISSAMLRSPRELSPELGGRESSPSPSPSAWPSPLAYPFRPPRNGSGVFCPAILRRSSQTEMLGHSPPSTSTSPYSMLRPRSVPRNLESSSFLLCFFLSASQNSSH